MISILVHLDDAGGRNYIRSNAKKKSCIKDFSFEKRFARSAFAQNMVLCLMQYEEMLTSKCRNSIKAGSLPMKSVNYHSLISPITRVEIQPLSYKYGINRLPWVIRNSCNITSNHHIIKLHRTFLVQIDCNLYRNRNVSKILRPVVLPHLRGLPNTIFQQDNMLHVLI